MWKRLKDFYRSEKKLRRAQYLVFPPVECLTKANPATAVCQTHHAEHQPCLPACKSRPGLAQIIPLCAVRLHHQLCFDGDILDAAVVSKGANNTKVNVNY